MDPPAEIPTLVQQPPTDQVQVIVSEPTEGMEEGMETVVEFTAGTEGIPEGEEGQGYTVVDANTLIQQDFGK